MKQIDLTKDPKRNNNLSVIQRLNYRLYSKFTLIILAVDIIVTPLIIGIIVWLFSSNPAVWTSIMIAVVCIGIPSISVIVWKPQEWFSKDTINKLNEAVNG